MKVGIALEELQVGSADARHSHADAAFAGPCRHWRIAQRDSSGRVDD
jgi:hypothetical protein